MTTKYEIGDTVVLKGKITSIEIYREGVFYKMADGFAKDGKEVLIPERVLLGRINTIGEIDN